MKDDEAELGERAPVRCGQRRTIQRPHLNLTFFSLPGRQCQFILNTTNMGC